MKLNELHTVHLTEEENQLAEYTLDKFLEYFEIDENTPLLEDEGGGDFGGGDMGDIDIPDGPGTGSSPGDGGTPTPEPPKPPVQPPGNGAWYGAGFGGAMWFNMFRRQLGWLVVSSNVKNRLKELGIKGDAMDRIDNQIKMAKKHVDSLLTNPMQFNMKQYQYVTPGKKSEVVTKLNQNIKSTMKKSLVTLPKGTFLPGAK